MIVTKNRHQETGITPGDLEVYELLCVPVIAVDTGFNIIFINEKACEVTGYSREDVREKKLFDIATPGELKKKLLRVFQGQIFERDFSVRSSLVTRNGRIRNVEWQCRTMYQGILRAGAVITFVDLTGAETVINMARFMAGNASVELIACGFMDLLSSPLNLKLARISLDVPGRQALAFSRAYPSGGVRKKPKQALREGGETSAPPGPHSFPLRADGRVIGTIELTPYGGSALTVVDESYVSSLCDILSAGIARILCPVSRAGDVSPAMVEPQAPGIPPADTAAMAEAVRLEDLTRQLMSMLPQGVIICDRGGQVTTVNESAVRVLGIPRARMEGRMVVEIVERLAIERESGRAVSPRSFAICRALTTGKPVMNTLSVLLVNGSRRKIITSAVPLRDSAGNVTGCMATARDVTVINAIIRIGQIALGRMNIDDFVEESMDLVMNALGLRLASLYLLGGDGLKLRLQKGDHSGMPAPECRDVPDPMSPTLLSRTFLGRKPLLIKDYRRCASVRLFDPLARKRPIRSMAGVPLLAGSDVIGVLLAATGDGQPIDETQLAELSVMCSQIASGLRHARQA